MCFLGGWTGCGRHTQMFTPHSCFYSCCVLDIHIVLKVLFVYIYLMKMILLGNYVGFFSLVFVWYCSFCGKLILMLFIFYLIRKCNLNLRMMVRLCMCVSVHVCVASEETCVDRAIENERKNLFSLCFFFSLSPSLLPEGQGLIPNVSWNKLIVFLTLETQSYLSAAS